MKLVFLICDGFFGGIFFLRVRELRELIGEFNEVLALSKTCGLFFFGGLALKDGVKSNEVPRIIYKVKIYKAVAINNIKCIK